MMDNDICLIKTKKPIKMNESTAVMCITDDELDEPVYDDECWIAGWGRDSYWDHNSSPVLLKSMKAELDYCSGHSGYTEFLSLLCTKYPYYRDEKTCSGDMGAPVVCAKHDKPRDLHRKYLTRVVLKCKT